MKAKTYFARMRDCVTENGLAETVHNTLIDIIKETVSTIERRQCTTEEDIKKVVEFGNTKWKRIIEMANEQQFEVFDGDGESKQKVIIHLIEDGFKAAFVETHPEYSFVFDLNRHKECMNQRRKEMEDKAKKAKELIPYIVTPFEKLTMDNLLSEILNCLAALGNYVEIGIPLDVVRPLAFRIRLLRHWEAKGAIDLNEVKEFEADPENFKYCCD